MNDDYPSPHELEYVKIGTVQDKTFSYFIECLLVFNMKCKEAAPALDLI